MPCNGIAVLTAHTLVDLEQHMADPAHRRAFREWLRAQGLPVCDWWPAQEGDRTQWALGIASDWVGHPAPASHTWRRSSPPAPG